MLGIKELDKTIKPKGLMIIESEASFPYEAVMKRISADAELYYFDGPASLAEKIFGKAPENGKKLMMIAIGKEEPPDKLIIFSLNGMLIPEKFASGISLELDFNVPSVNRENAFYFLQSLRNVMHNKLAIVREFYDALPEKDVMLFETAADIVLRMHPMGSKAVAIIRRHPRPSLIGETIEFAVIRMRDLIEDARVDEEKFRKLLEELRKRKTLEESEKQALLDLLTRLKDRNERAFQELKTVLAKLVKLEEIEAYVEENIEEYEYRGAP